MTISEHGTPTPGLDPVYAGALRQVLVDQAASTPMRSSPSDLVRRRWQGLTRRASVGISVVVAVACAGTAAYAISVILPGGTQTTSLAAPVTVVRSGTATVELGARPAGVTSVAVEVSCLTAGRIDWPDGSSMVCSAADAARQDPPGKMVMPLADGQHTLTFSAAPEVTWRLTATYAATTETAWKVNKRGETYGVVNSHGEPTLIAVVATNGQQGYAYGTDLANAGGPPPTSPDEAVARTKANEGKTFSVPVYESDGKTQIGVFTVGG